MPVNFQTSTSPATVIVGETFIYEVELTQTGTSTATNVEIGANFPPEFSVINITPYISGDLETGNLAVADVAPGSPQIVTIEVLANGIPSSNPYEQNLSYQYNEPGQSSGTETFPPVNIVQEDNLLIDKTSVEDEAVVGDIIPYELNLSNDGIVDLLDVIISDPLHPSLQFVSGSVVVEGISQPDANITSGVNIGNLHVGENITITFDAEVISDSESNVPNVANAVYQFIPEGGGPIEGGSAESNEFDVTVYVLNVPITKTAVPSSEEPLILGDTIEYTVTMTNESDLEITDVKFFDDLPAAVVLNPDSINVNGPLGIQVINNPDLSQGVNIGNLKKGEEFIITYTAEVVSGICSAQIINEAYAQFNFEFRNMTIRDGETDHVSTVVDVGIINFIQLSSEYCINVPCQKPDIEEINNISADIIINDSYVIKNIVNTSNEGQKLSGFKLIVHGEIVIMVNYTAANIEQSNHSFSKRIPFSNFIILPEDYKGQNLDISNIIENIDATNISERVVCCNIVYMLAATIC